MAIRCEPWRTVNLHNLCGTILVLPGVDDFGTLAGFGTVNSTAWCSNRGTLVVSPLYTVCHATDLPAAY